MRNNFEKENDLFQKKILSLQPNMEYYVSMKKIMSIALANMLIAITILSCTNEKACTPEKLLSKAKNMAEADPQGALLVIDSLHELYPKEIRSRRIADTLEWNIELTEAMKNLPVLDSMLREDSVKLQELTHNFNYSNIDEYQDLGIYEHHKFRTENNTDRCYLKTTINDFGELIFISYYSGKKAKHNIIVVNVDGFEKRINTTENISSYLDEGNYREFITINDSIDNGITVFIAGCENDVKVRLIGEEENDFTEYAITKSHIQAFKETLELAKLLQEMHLFSLQTKKFSKKIELLNKRLKNEA